MKSILISLLLLIQFSTLAQFNSQTPDLTIPFFISFDDPPYPPPYIGDSLFVGIDSIATDSIDELLGEIELPPIPPPGYPAFLILPYNNFDGSLISQRDFRYGEIPYSGIIEFRIKFCSECGATIHWQLPEGITGVLQDLIGGIIINEPISGIDSFYVQINPWYTFKLILTFDNYVPTELTSFTSSVAENYVTLNWQTATETNNSGFEVQRKQVFNSQSSVGNGEWDVLSFITGNGTKTEPHSYFFVDKELNSGKYQYRLKQIDFDGTFEYSNTIEVEINSPTKFSLEQNYPNPFNPVTTIKFCIPSVGTRLALSVQLNVYDVLGKEVATLVNEERPAGNYEVDFDATQLASGIYYYQLRAGEFVETKKMILLK